MLAVTLALFVGALVALWFYMRHRHNYWAAQGIKSPPATPLFGHMHKLFAPDYMDFLDEVYENYLKEDGICGTYNLLQPSVMVGTPEFARLFLVKEFEHFAERRVFDTYHTEDSLMNEMLFNIKGEEWKRYRNVLTPTFTSGNLKSFHPLIGEKVDDMVSVALKSCAENDFIDLRDLSGRFVLDTIATCAFGFESNCMHEKKSRFHHAVHFFTGFTFIQNMKMMLLFSSPTLYKMLNTPLYSKELQFFEVVVKDVVAQRRKGFRRGDFLDMMLDAQAADKDGLITDKRIVSSSCMFILAGFETTGANIAWAAYLLAKYPEEQKRLRQELLEKIKEHGSITYQALNEAKFLDSVIQESLRLYSPAIMTERECTKTFTFPGTNITVHPGEVVQIPINNIHKDERYWPEPEVFRPDRFMPENKQDIVPFSHLPFGYGPKNCIGMRFALMEAKHAIAKLVLEAELKLVPGREEVKTYNDQGFLKPVDNVIPLIIAPLNKEKITADFSEKVADTLQKNVEVTDTVKEENIMKIDTIERSG